MTSCSDTMTREQIEVAITALSDASFVDHREGFRVVMLSCVCCSREFLEELGSAKRKAADGEELLCISCEGEDEDA